jgi:thiamine pyrophosphate-dependent acetolactate synthase large subunit-like protein
MNRTEAITKIIKDLNQDDIVISSTGLISRELYKQKDRKLNFYMMGSMGCAVPIGLGVALNVKQKVIVITGDGSALMGLGSLVTCAKEAPKNLRVIILDNKIHESTGGQETSSMYINFKDVWERVEVWNIKSDENVPPRIKLSPVSIQRRFRNAINAISD